MHELIDATILGADGPTILARTTAATAGTLAGVPRITARVGVSVRAGTLADVPFLDRLQKAHSRELGFLPTMALEGKIRLGQVLVAEAGGRAVGYLIAADRYFKRDEIGYVTQINVLPEVRRSLVAATLLQAQFDRSAYGCRLYCCWCAQDLKANEFWEAMGFTPIAFRTGSRTKGRDAAGKAMPRIHLFWQKRVRPGDGDDRNARGGTAWWYPAQTSGGEMREDRLVFPIPPGVHWRDVLPIVLPEQCGAARPDGATRSDAIGELPGGEIGVEDTALSTRPWHPAAAENRSRQPKSTEAKAAAPVGGGLWFGRSTESADAARAARAEAKALAKAAAKAASPIDPRLTAMARELRDRWAEQADGILALPAKHDVRRAAPAGARAATLPIAPTLALPDAA